MKFFVSNSQMYSDKIVILGDDVKHIKTVLRLKVDNDIHICCSETSKNFLCKISNLLDNSIECNIIQEIDDMSETNTYIHIMQGLPKYSKMEFIIEKCTEIGVKEITPIQMKRSVVKLNKKEKINKILRWQKIAKTASKQSGRSLIPKINEIEIMENIYTKLENYDIILVAYEDEKQNSLKNELLNLKKVDKNLRICVIIGPEGGIDVLEIKNLKNYGAKVITLGKRILRTETVALVVSSILIYELEG